MRDRRRHKARSLVGVARHKVVAVFGAEKYLIGFVRIHAQHVAVARVEIRILRSFGFKAPFYLLYLRARVLGALISRACLLVAKNRLILRAKVKNLSRKSRELPGRKFRIYIVGARDDVQILDLSSVFKYLKILKFYLARFFAKLDTDGICRDLALGEGIRNLAAKIGRYRSSVGKFDIGFHRAREVIKFGVFYF